jgi:hypothetical protein
MKKRHHYSKTPSREVRCQICTWAEVRWYGDGILVEPCPICGCRVTFAKNFPGEPPITHDLSVSKPQIAQAA